MRRLMIKMITNLIKRGLAGSRFLSMSGYPGVFYNFKLLAEQ